MLGPEDAAAVCVHIYPLDVCPCRPHIWGVAKTKPLTVQEFFKRFPDDDACLEHLLRARYGKDPACPKCGEIGKIRRLRKMPAYTCNCGHHIHPMQGTPFALTRTPLQKWFFTLYMFTTTRNGVSAKEIQRQCGVTYKTAWRMGHEIRKYMGWVDGDGELGTAGAVVETDETFVGGRDRGSPGPRGDKSIVFGMVERDGEFITHVVPNAKRDTLLPIIARHVVAGARMATDGYCHGTARHRKG